MRDVNLECAWELFPNYGIEVEPLAQRIQVKFGDVILADSCDVVRLNEQELNTTYYFPRRDIIQAQFRRTDKLTFCPFKGLATQWDLVSGEDSIELGAWSYDLAFTKMKKIQNHIAFHDNALLDLVRID